MEVMQLIGASVKNIPEGYLCVLQPCKTAVMKLLKHVIWMYYTK